MKKIFFSIFFLVFSFCLVREAFADKVYLKNGRSIEGIIKRQDANTIELEIKSGMIKFDMSAVERVEKSSHSEYESLRQDWREEKEADDKRAAENQAKYEARPRSVEVASQDNSIFVKAILNGKVEANLLLDTGATNVMLRKNVAAKLGINLERLKPDMRTVLADGRQAAASSLILDSIKVQGVEARNVSAAILLDDYGDAGMQDGLLGMSFLKQFAFKIDYKDGKLILEKKP